MAPAPAHCTCLLLFSALISGVHLQFSSSEKALIYKPVLQPHESIPPTGTYMLRTATGVPCIRVTLGAEFLVLEQKTWYFNLDPSRVTVSGTCGSAVAILSLALHNEGGSLQFFFTKEKKVYYVKKITAHLSPFPVCKNCSRTYTGIVDHEKLFVSKGGRSFKCNSESLLHLSSTLRLKMVPLQMQAFSVPKGQYGKEVECWADYNKRVIPIVIGAVIVGLLLIALLTYVIMRDRRRTGYESL
ncbi:lysosome-associated membrane glycoprotein 3 [Boleophthalmus pectinirostris]|uniref:lysosome-associated membrane glycoprotein 3 n=1 Tax=Boleophthalmus pectinirostris TaxID=150288 RepID=UPI00242DB34F|nr:lysosome-associated membrane glycoprotein 3 [Boleophthalmus pectinirostris]